MTSPADYYAQIRDYASNAGAEAIVERGRQAGRDLGDDPAATIDALVERVLAEVAGVDDPLIAVIGGLGIRLSNYLPTRMFELAVHGLDIAGATGVDVHAARPTCSRRRPCWPRASASPRQGRAVLLALTGRTALPPRSPSCDRRR